MKDAYCLSDAYVKNVEASFDNTREAHTLLDLIVAEFTSDPMSVQCFDLSIVQRAKDCVAERKWLTKLLPGV